ncbi:MAG TPA: NADH-quinone oxidoreductase subunit M, partial [Actinomycetota bacterium]|nr:NADH-quinone oxidoreductase subunit M [Actinomycetota bacterium]
MTGWEKSAITLATFLPAAGAVVIAMMPSRADRLIRALGILFTGAALVVGVIMLFGFDYGAHQGLQFELNTGWISTIHARYHVGIDGISLPLFELTLLLSFLCAIYTWRILPDPGRPKAFLALMMLLETGMAGTFIAFDLILFFVFWELVLVPMYFLIAVWGSANREYAAIKFFLYTLFGSVFMLLGFLALFFKSDPHTFDIIQLTQQASGPAFAITKSIQLIIFAGLFLGFAIKVPMWPFHTWLPDAHTEAPTVGSVLLAGIMLKMGTYGFVRISLPVLPDAARVWAPVIGVLAVIAIVYASLACLAQKDLKRLIAFSSVGHMGFVMLGIATLTPLGINAAIFGMVAHGVITGMLFFEVGSIYDRYHTRQIADIGGGMLQKVPALAGIFAFTAIASLGLPGLAGFWGEITALLSAYNP